MPFLRYSYTVIAASIVLFLGCKQTIKVSQLEELTAINISNESDTVFNRSYVPTQIQIIEGGKKTIYQGKAKIRGGYSISFPKNSFEIDFKEDISISGLPADDDWILNANFIDKTFLRHVISYKIFQQMGSGNIASKTRYIEVSTDSIYNGLYVLMEKMDRSTLGVSKSETASYIFKDPNLFRKDYHQHSIQNYNQQTFPKIDIRNQDESIQGLREFILNSSESEFQNQFDHHFDTDNILDWNILLLLSGNKDGVLKNFYLYKTSESQPSKITPWDYDHSFGRDGDGAAHEVNNNIGLERSILFNRLLKSKWYRKLLKDKWISHNEHLLKEDNLFELIDGTLLEFKEVIDRNFEKWPIESAQYYDDNSFKEEVDLFKRHLLLRKAWLDGYFEAL